MAHSDQLQKIFVYGTLKRGGRLHQHLAGATFLGVASTLPRYRMFQMEWYPALVEVGAGGISIEGEVWIVDPSRLTLLDEVEEVDQGLYQRREIRLAESFEAEHVEAWFFLRSVAGREDCGAVWTN